MADWTAVERCRRPSGWGRRHRLAILGFCGFALSYAMRFSLSIAIVAMVNTEMRHGTPPKQKLSTSHGAIFKSDICPHEYDHTPHEAMDSKLNLYHVQTILVEDDSVNGVLGSNVSGSSSFEVRNNEGSGIPTNGSLLQPSTSSNYYLNDKGEHSLEYPPAISTFLPINENISSGAEAPSVSIRQNDESEEQGEFFWSEKEQGVILGSFFWGYTMTQCLGGWISQRIGGKLPFGVGLIITALFAIVTPTAARFGGMNWLIFVRIVQGLAGGVTVPSMQSILSKWFPPEERGKLGSFTLAGMPFGTSAAMLCSGYLIHYFGWPSVFYVTGLMTVLWFLLWSYFAHASPFDDPTIDQAELRYIQASLHKGAWRGGGAKQTKESLRVPWGSVLLSLPFWAILICNTCETWFLYTINAELPTYMKTVLRFDIKQNSFMSAFPHLLTLVVSVILTNVGDNLIERQYLSIATIRKISTSIAMWGPAAALLGVAYSGCDRVKTVALLATAIALNGGKFGGFLVNIIDIAPNYAGILMGVINTISSMPGFFAPWIAGIIINEDPSLENWRLVFLITGSIAFVGNLVYILCASGMEQSWNEGSSANHDNDNNTGRGNENVDKSFGTGYHTSSISLESINQAIISDEISGRRNNKDEAITNGIYIIPMNHVNHHHHPHQVDNENNDHDDNHEGQAPHNILPPPARDNSHGEGRGQ